MDNNLVIVESPTKAKTIQKFLGTGYTVKASQGHIRDLQEKSLSIDVNNNFEPEYVVPADKKRIVSDLKAAAKKADMVWLASDEDREGEAISWHLAKTLELDPSCTRRIAFHEITKTAIQEAIQNPREIDLNLVNAQQARRVLDRLVGFELSPVLWKKIQRGLSAGRVQSVALRLVVDREREIMAFNSAPYYRVEAIFSIEGKQVKGTLDTRFPNIEDARKFLSDSIGATYSVRGVEKKDGTRCPAPPFTTSTLQQEAAAKLHFPVSLTMRLAQSLYEHGLITYMRTDSTNLSSLALGTAKQYITDTFGPEYHHFRQFKTKSKGAQEAHEAIRPTFIENTSIEGTAQEKKLYELIWKRTVASQMADAKVSNTTIKVASDRRSEQYAIQSATILFDGFLKLWSETPEEGEEEDSGLTIPDLQEGTVLKAVKVNADCKYSQPPMRYSERTLVKKLEELGIGRPSTYAPTISTLTTGRGYIVKGDKEGEKKDVVNLELKGGKISEAGKVESVGTDRGKLLPQEIGILVTDYLTGNFADIMDYDFTAGVEEKFDLVADGKMGWSKLISEFYTPFHQKVDITLKDGQYSHVERVIGKDPSDGKEIIAKFGQYGPYVQKGDGETKQFASLAKGQIIESLTLEEALKLFQLPRTIGQHEGIDILALKGRFGPFIKYGEQNISLPKGKDPLKITLEECVALISANSTKKVQEPVLVFESSGISVFNGKFGPYIKHDGSNYKIPTDRDAAKLTEQECLDIISQGTPTKKKFRRFTKKK